jgi:hypothetical protein
VSGGQIDFGLGAGAGSEAAEPVAGRLCPERVKAGPLSRPSGPCVKHAKRYLTAETPTRKAKRPASDDRFGYKSENYASETATLSFHRSFRYSPKIPVTRGHGARTTSPPQPGRAASIAQIFPMIKDVIMGKIAMGQKAADSAVTHLIAVSVAFVLN